MLRRRPFLLTLPLLLQPPARAAPPQANLLVELRWVDAAVSGAVLSGARSGGPVVGTAGSVSPQPGGFTASTRRDTVDMQAPLRVLNGRTARLMLSEEAVLTTLDIVVQRPDSPNPQPTAVLRQRPRQQLRGFVVTPNWPGGAQPVQVELQAIAAGEELAASVQVPLGDWITVARSGAPVAARSAPGTVSSRDAAAPPQRELQLRVQLAP